MTARRRPPSWISWGSVVVVVVVVVVETEVIRDLNSGFRINLDPDVRRIRPKIAVLEVTFGALTTAVKLPWKFLTLIT